MLTHEVVSDTLPMSSFGATGLASQDLPIIATRAMSASLRTETLLLIATGIPLIEFTESVVIGFPRGVLFWDIESELIHNFLKVVIIVTKRTLKQISGA